MFQMCSGSSGATYPWGEPGYGDSPSHAGGAFDDSDVEPPPPPEGAAAGDVLAEFLVAMLLEGKISSKSLCTIAYWSARAGAKGKFEEYAHNPADQSTGHFMRTIDKANGIKIKDLAALMYHVRVPGLAKYDLSRTSHAMPVQTPHEAIEQEIRDKPSLLDDARAAAAEGQLPQRFYDHPVVRRKGNRVAIPLALYMDGIAMTRNDSIPGICVYSLLTCRRHLVAVLRKSFLCKCGCGGRCSLHPVFAMTR